MKLFSIKNLSLKEARVIIIDGDRGKFYPKVSDFSPEGFCLFLTAKNVTNKGFRLIERQFISEEKHLELRKGILQKGDLVLTTRGTVGNIALYDQSIPFNNVRINSGMVILRNSGSIFDTQYLYSLFRSQLFFTQLEKLKFGSAQPQLTVGTLNELEFPCPSLPEQKKIAEIFSCWDRAIEVAAQLKHYYNQKKIVIERTLLKKNTKAAEWSNKILSLKDAGVIIVDGDRGKFYPKELDFSSEGFCLFLTAKNVTNNGFRLDKKQFISEEKHLKMRKGILQKGDLVLTTRGSVGNIALYDQSIPFNHVRINSGMAILRNSGNIFDTQYLYSLFRSQLFFTQLEKLKFGSAQPQLTIGTLNELEFPSMPLPEQKKIAKILSDMDRIKDLLENQGKYLLIQKQALMQQLLTGKIRVKVAS